jgi:hypothetical protein
MESNLAVRSVYDKTGSIRATARATGLSRSAVKKIIETEGPVYTGQTSERKIKVRKVPKSGVKYYIVTSAQNNTLVHDGFWKNLLTYKDWLLAREGTDNVELLVSRYTYNKTGFQRVREKVKAYSDASIDSDGVMYASEIADYVCDDSVELAPNLVFCGEMNILPTAVRPLSGLETYTGRKSGIFPHAKMSMASVAQIKGEGAKFNYTTGTVTKRNYLQRKEGIKAEFHHIYGALIVEVDEDGCWYVRQISAADDGSFQDLDRRVSREKVAEGVRVEAINWGDIHDDCMDEEVRSMNWGKDGILDTLRPHFQFMHDSLDFRSRNHHDTKDPHAFYLKYKTSRDNVASECTNLARFLSSQVNRSWCETIIVDSNHDNAMVRWLREGDYRFDPPNAVFFLERQLAYYKAMESGNDSYHVVEDALRATGLSGSFRFLRQDESFVICADHGGIECGMHGDLGPDGQRGNPLNLSRIGRRANTGHTHSARIVDGLYVAGTCAMNPKYKKGPSSWSYSHVVTYSNGKRAIITCWEGKWRA